MNTNNTVTTPPEEETIEYTLTINSGSGGNVSSSGGTYEEGSSVTITATPDDNYTFSGWQGIDSSESAITISVNSNLTLTANFEEIPPEEDNTKTEEEEGNGEDTGDENGNESSADGYFNDNYDLGTVPENRVLTGNLGVVVGHSLGESESVYIDTYNAAMNSISSNVFLNSIANIKTIIEDNTSLGSFSLAYPGHVSWHDTPISSLSSGTLVHEWGHVVHFKMTNAIKSRIIGFYNESRDRYQNGSGYAQDGLINVGTKETPVLEWDGSTYPKQLHNDLEYMACAFAALFGYQDGSGTINNRENLQNYEPNLYALLVEIFE